MMAFRTVLEKRQSNYSDVLAWLDERIRSVRAKRGKEVGKLTEICVKKCIEDW